jgi:hypothetical protein
MARLVGRRLEVRLPLRLLVRRRRPPRLGFDKHQAAIIQALGALSACRGSLMDLKVID